MSKITLPFLEARKAALQQQLAQTKQHLEQTLANANAINGAIQECDNMIAREAEPDEKPEPEPKPASAKKIN